MKILLTGGSGFIGKNLLEQLSSKFNFIAPSHKELDFLDANKVADFLRENKFDIVIHAANFGGSRAQAGLPGVFEANKKMFLNLAENSKHFGRMIFLGSGAEYNKQNPIIKVKESDFGKVNPQDEYGQAKYFASEYIAKHANIVNFRLFGVFGKYEDYKIRFISNAICRALYGMPIIIRQNLLFDYVYVNDLARIIEYFIEHWPKEKFYNVGRGEPVELLSLAQMVKTAAGGSPEIIVKNPGLGKEYTCQNSLLMNELKDFKFVSYEQAISELYGFYKQYLASIKKADLGFDE